ncbi:hypothetical protein BG011_003120 [Mortierella polycephala]|uniref:PIPK domain-containing protein n=1 Tax=Mortierella polycephala TaxID=41804 RepID=A0A9P6UAE9_9FUNG|nr:hypothetical protein BG011_003120 [Mortierella polycephala]
MVSSKPLPPIPAPLSEKRSHLFSTVTNLKRRSQTPSSTSSATVDPTTDNNASSTKTTPQSHTDTTNNNTTQNTASNMFSFLTSAVTATAPKAEAETGNNRPQTPNPPPAFLPKTSSPASASHLTSTAAGAGAGAAAASATRGAKSQVNMVIIDQRSFQHLRAIARQSIASSCLDPEILWLRLFMDMLQKLAANVSDAWQQIDEAHQSIPDTHRESMDNAAATADPTMDKANTAKEQTTASETKGTGDQELPHFSYNIQLVKHVSSTRECSFAPGVFEGDPVLVEERSKTELKRQPKKERRIKVLLGGTISLSAGVDDLPKAELILEILVFALCSLQLEMNLMQDHDVVRPESTLTIPPSYDTDLRNGKTSPGASAQQNALGNSKRISKGSMFFGWLSRGALPAKYKKGTTQLSSDADMSTSGQKAIVGKDAALSDDLHSLQNHRFARIIQQVEKAIISVSPDIVFPPPHLLIRLRDEETVGPDSRRKSFSWEDVEFVAKKIGFGNRMNRHSIAGAGQLNRLSSTASTTTDGTVSKGNRLPIDSRAGLDHLMTNSNSLQGIFNHQSISFSYSYYWSASAAAPCVPPNVITVEYYRKEGMYEDMGLGEMIECMCFRAGSSCPNAQVCGRKRLEHISTYTHGEARINVTVEKPRSDSAADFESDEFKPFASNKRSIGVWTRCKICGASTKPRALSRAARLYSFCKYLELLLYGQHFEPGPRPLCSHVKAKDAIVRCFINRGLVVTFEYESIDLFEMRISRLQVNETFPTMPCFQHSEHDDDTHDYSTTYSPSTIVPSSRASVVSMQTNSDYLKEADQSDLLNTARLEIMHFYESCKKIIVAMEERLGETKSIMKQSSKKSSTTSSGSAAMDPAKKAALDRLDELGNRWKAEEFELYDQLRHITIPRLNDVRNRFRDCAKRTMRSMESWQKESHLAVLEAIEKDAIEWVLPDYARSDALHTFPGTPVIVREEEPSSIIAATLSSKDYLILLSSVLNHDKETAMEEKAPKPPKKDFDANAILTTPKPLRNSRSMGSSTATTRKSGSSGSEGSTAVMSTTQGSSSRSDVGSQTAGAQDHGSDDEDNEDEGGDDDDSFLVVDGYQTNVQFVQVSKVDFTSLIPNGTMSPRNTIGLGFGSGRYGKNSTLSVGQAEKKDDLAMARPASMLAMPSQTPGFMSSPVMTPSSEMDQTPSFFLSAPSSRSTTPTPGSKPKNSFGYHSLTSGLSGTMKGLSLNALSEKIGSGFSSYGAGSIILDKSDKDFLNADGTERTIKEAIAAEKELESTAACPHLKARFSHGKTSFSCTVYYAAGFDTLRRRCGIHQNYVQSLSRCNNWNANGGKSKSSFYKTKDDRFVVKQMVSSWNIAEKDELLKFAPKYLDYMERSHEAPTVLAKIFGFYTFKIKDGYSAHAMKIDVLVMENLFFDQRITKTFDLKGIQDRHAGSKPMPPGGGSTTLWDGDFIEGRYDSLLQIHTHSKKIIRESLLNDTEFLAGANIMDYSLLVGVDEERKELVVGIVDFIGAYTWSKRIESKGKTTLRGAKDNVTVLPPQQYKSRFRMAMERYFLAVPDKWSKTPVEHEQEEKDDTATLAHNNINGVSPIVPERTSEWATALDVERTLRTKTSGYLEKMSKAILPSKSAADANGGGGTTATVKTTADTSNSTPPAAAALTNGRATATATTTPMIMTDELVDVRSRMSKLPRVFHPLD